MLKAKINTNLKKGIKDEMAFGRDKLEGMSLPVITGPQYGVDRHFGWGLGGSLTATENTLSSVNPDDVGVMGLSSS